MYHKIYMKNVISRKRESISYQYHINIANHYINILIDVFLLLNDLYVET